jgi:hypothetical protein
MLIGQSAAADITGFTRRDKRILCFEIERMYTRMINGKVAIKMTSYFSLSCLAPKIAIRPQSCRRPSLYQGSIWKRTSARGSKWYEARFGNAFAAVEITIRLYRKKISHLVYLSISTARALSFRS